MDPSQRRALEEAWTRYLKANREQPGIYHGEPPRPQDYGCTTHMDIWRANEIERRIRREMERTC